MAKLSEYSNDFELPPEGKCVATLVRFIDVGMQASKFGASRQAELAFEIANMRTEDDRPMLAFKRVFNLSPRSKNFREIVRALTGLHDIRDVESRELVGKACELAIEHITNEDGNTFADVECRPLKGAKVTGEPETKFVFFSLHPTDYDPAVLPQLSDRQREKITGSTTYRDLIATLEHAKACKGKPAAAIIDDDFPENLGGAPKAKPRRKPPAKATKQPPEDGGIAFDAA